MKKLIKSKWLPIGTLLVKMIMMLFDYYLSLFHFKNLNPHVCFWGWGSGLRGKDSGMRVKGGPG